MKSRLLVINWSRTFSDPVLGEGMSERAWTINAGMVRGVTARWLAALEAEKEPNAATVRNTARDRERPAFDCVLTAFRI